MRLDGHPITGAQKVKIERGQNRDGGGRRGLMTTNLGAIGIWPHMVGVVDDEGGEPEDTALDLVERS